MSKARTARKRIDGVATRARILEIAGQRFADAGFAQTASKEIAALAEVDLASINYHFGDRAGLYQAVLAEAHRRIADLHDIERLMASALPAPEKLRELIRFLLGGVGGQVSWPVIVLGREILSPSSHLQVLQQQEILPKLQAILPMLSEITLIPVDDPVLLRCLPCIAAPCAMIALLGRSGTELGERIHHAATEDLVGQLHAYALGGLAAVRERYRGAGR